MADAANASRSPLETVLLAFSHIRSGLFLRRSANCLSNALGARKDWLVVLTAAQVAASVEAHRD